MGRGGGGWRRFPCVTEDELAASAAALVDAGLTQGVVYLEGELGTGKTAWARAALRRLGVEGPVPSPTFTLIETYRVRPAGREGEECPVVEVAHVDLYRIGDPEEVEYLGLRDLLAGGPVLLLVEWPERGAGHLPAPDLTVRFRYRHAPDGTLAPGRDVLCRAGCGRFDALIVRAVEALAAGG